MTMVVGADPILEANVLRDLNADVQALFDRLTEFAHAHGWIDGEWLPRYGERSPQPMNPANPLHTSATAALVKLEVFAERLEQRTRRAELEAINAARGGEHAAWR